MVKDELLDAIAVDLLEGGDSELSAAKDAFGELVQEAGSTAERMGLRRRLGEKICVRSGIRDCLVGFAAEDVALKVDLFGDEGMVMGLGAQSALELIRKRLEKLERAAFGAEDPIFYPVLYREGGNIVSLFCQRKVWEEARGVFFKGEPMEAVSGDKKPVPLRGEVLLPVVPRHKYASVEGAAHAVAFLGEAKGLRKVAKKHFYQLFESCRFDGELGKYQLMCVLDVLGELRVYGGQPEEFVRNVAVAMVSELNPKGLPLEGLLKECMLMMWQTAGLRGMRGLDLKMDKAVLGCGVDLPGMLYGVPVDPMVLIENMKYNVTASAKILEHGDLLEFFGRTFHSAVKKFCEAPEERDAK